MFARLNDVLAIDVDAVAKIQGKEGLFGLWSGKQSKNLALSHSSALLFSCFEVFTKCKESLHDGRRLENITWRLWHREMSVQRADREGYDSSSEALVATPSLVPGSFLSPLSSETESDGDDISVAVDDDELLPGPSASTVPRKSSRSHSSTSHSSRRRLTPSTDIPSDTSVHHRPPQVVRTGQQLSASQPSAPGSTRPSLDSYHRTLSAPHRLSTDGTNPPQARKCSPTRSNLNIGLVISTLLPEKVDIPRSPRAVQPTPAPISNNNSNSNSSHLPPAKSCSRVPCSDDLHVVVVSSVSNVTEAPARSDELSANNALADHATRVRSTVLPSAPSPEQARSVLVTDSTTNPALILTNPTPRATPPTTPSRASTVVNMTGLGTDSGSQVNMNGNAPGQFVSNPEEHGHHPRSSAVPVTPNAGDSSEFPHVQPFLGLRSCSSSNAVSTEPQLVSHAPSRIAPFPKQSPLTKRQVPTRAIPHLLASPFSQPVVDSNSSPSNPPLRPGSVSCSGTVGQNRGKIFFIQRTPPGEGHSVEGGSSTSSGVGPSNLGPVFPLLANTTNAAEPADEVSLPVNPPNPSSPLNLSSPAALDLPPNADGGIETASLTIQYSTHSVSSTSILGDIPTMPTFDSVPVAHVVIGESHSRDVRDRVGHEVVAPITHQGEPILNLAFLNQF